MCQPSATTAIEPNSMPPTISATIIAAVSNHHEPGAPLMPVVLGAEKDVGMLPGLNGMGVHGVPIWRKMRLGVWHRPSLQEIKPFRGSVTAFSILTLPRPLGALPRHPPHQRLRLVGKPHRQLP